MRHVPATMFAAQFSAEELDAVIAPGACDDFLAWAANNYGVNIMLAGITAGFSGYILWLCYLAT